VHADQNTVLADEDQVIGVIYNLDACHTAAGVVADAQTTALGNAVVINQAAAAFAVLGDGQHGCAGAADAHAHNIVTIT